MGSWVKSWHELYNLAISYKCQILLETNNDKEGIAQLDLFKKQGLEIKLISDHSKDDVTGNHGRKTYLIS